MNRKEYSRHYEESVVLKAKPEEVFAYVDDHHKFSSHMNEPSWVMGGSKMETTVDDGYGQRIGSHITMSGKVFGINLFLDEVITKHEPPNQKVWETVGNPRLMVIGSYQLGFELKPVNGGTSFRVFIDYELPKFLSTRWLGYLFGGMYAKWCVRQMIQGVQEQFKSNGN